MRSNDETIPRLGTVNLLLTRPELCYKVLKLNSVDYDTRWPE